MKANIPILCVGSSVYALFPFEVSSVKVVPDLPAWHPAPEPQVELPRRQATARVDVQSPTPGRRALTAAAGPHWCSRLPPLLFSGS